MARIGHAARPSARDAHRTDERRRASGPVQYRSRECATRPAALTDVTGMCRRRPVGATNAARAEPQRAASRVCRLVQHVSGRRARAMAR